LDNSRRNFIKKAGYAAPAVLTMSSIPAIASVGSGDSTDPEVIQPVRWQTRERRNRLRRLERQGIEVERFNDWSQIDAASWTIIS